MHAYTALKQSIFTTGKRLAFHPQAVALRVGIALLALLLMAGEGLCGEFAPLVWTMPELRAMENTLRENGLDVREFEEKPDTKEQDRELRLHFGKKTLREDFAAFARLTWGKTLPRVDVTYGAINSRTLWDAMPEFPKLQCAYLGLYLPEAPSGADLKPLRDTACLKRLFTHTANLAMLPELPQVEEVFLRGRAAYEGGFSPEPIMTRFPNMVRLHLAVPFFDFSSVPVPASLEEIAMWTENRVRRESYGNVLEAYRLNTAKKIPSILRINGVPAGEFDPLAGLTPAQSEQYAALPGYIQVESEYREHKPRAQKPAADAALRGTFMVYRAGTYKKMAYEGNNQDLRAALADEPGNCATLVIYERIDRYRRPDRYVIMSMSDHHYVEQSLYILDREKNEMAKVWESSIRPMDGKRIPEPWEKIEELFVKRYGK